MAILDANLYFTDPAAPYAPTTATDNVAPFTIDTAPLTVPSGSGGASTPGYNSGTNTNAGRDLGVGGEMWLEVLVTTAVAQSANSTTFKLVTDSTATISSVNVLLASPAFTAAQLTAQSYWRTQLPASASYQRYLGLCVTITTTAWTAGAIAAYLLQNIQQSDLYQSGFALQ